MTGHDQGVQAQQGLTPIPVTTATPLLQKSARSEPESATSPKPDQGAGAV